LKCSAPLLCRAKAVAVQIMWHTSVSLRSLLPTEVSCEGGEKLGSESEEFGDEACFHDNVPLCYPSDSALADHTHRFDAFESSPGTLKGAVSLRQPGSLFDGPMVLFNDVVEILALTQKNSAGESTLGFQRLPLLPDRPDSYPR
jgi:hypothetical protein